MAVFVDMNKYRLSKNIHGKLNNNQKGYYWPESNVKTEEWGKLHVEKNRVEWQSQKDINVYLCYYWSESNEKSRGVGENEILI